MIQAAGGVVVPTIAIDKTRRAAVAEATQGTQSKVGLADAVDALRAELSEAMGASP